MQTVHPDYVTVHVDDPNNIRHVEGNVTYVFVPNKTLPLVQLAGPLAPLINPVLDPILRPMVEAGYNRPGGVTYSPLTAAKVPASASAAVEASPAERVSLSAPVESRTSPATKPGRKPRPAAAARDIAVQNPERHSRPAPAASRNPKEHADSRRG